jgi:DNA-binding SARP family transcriptional activator
MLPTFRIHLLGEFRLWLDDQPISSVNQPRQQALLAYLLLHRGAPMPRDQIAFSFWLDSPDSQARTNLRKLFLTLRRNLPAAEHFLFADYQNLGWRNDAPFVLDIADLEEALAQLEQAHFPLHALAERVMTLYRGELMPLCYEEWVLPLRRMLHERVVNTLAKTAAQLGEQREYGAAIRCAEYLLQLDPLHEETYRTLMQLRTYAGDRTGALRIYHACARILEQELAVPPAEPTQALYEQLLKAEMPVLLTATSPARAAGGPLVGRIPEWKALQHAWRAARSRPHFVTIWGEAGMGKSRLAEELIRWVRAQTATVAHAHAYTAEGALAYAPVTEWLRADGLRPALAGLAPLWLSEISRLLPELLIQRPEVPPPAPLTEEWQRQRFFEALAHVVLAAPAPRLLLLDDLHWCDTETQSWLRYLMRVNPQAPLLIVGTARSEEVDPAHPLMHLFHHLRQKGQYSEIDLAPFNAEETAELYSQLTSAHDPVQVEHLYRETEGNPLFVVEMTRAKLAQEPDELPKSSSSLLPPTIQAVIAARLAQLSPATRQLAQLAATMGRTFRVDVLAAAGEFDEDALLQGLDELWQRRIIREQGNGYDFSHDKIREVAYNTISRPRRQLLHRRIAQTMEQLYADHLDEVCGRLAVHFERAGESLRAVVYWLRAGDHALNTYAHPQALQHYDRALALAEDADTQAAAGFGLARAHFALDHLPQALEHAQQGLQHTNELDPLRAKLLYLQAELHFAAYDVDRCEASAEAALAAAEIANDTETLCQSLSLLGQVCSTRGDLDTEVQLITRALHICRQTRNLWREGRTLADLGWLQAQRGEFVEAAASATSALELLEQSSDRAGIAFACNVLGRALGGYGSYMAAFAAFRRSQEVAASIDHKFLMAQVPNMLGWLHQQLCDYTGALALDQEGVNLAQQWQKIPAEISARINVATDILHLGDPAGALAQLQAIEQRIEQEAFGFHRWRWQLRLLEAQALCQLALNQPGRAHALAQAGFALAKSTSARKHAAIHQELLGRALVQLGQSSAAIAPLRAAVALADQAGYQPLRWAGRWWLAQLHAEAGQVDLVQSYLADALPVIHAIAASLTAEPLRNTFLHSPLVQAISHAGQGVTSPGR